VAKQDLFSGTQTIPHLSSYLWTRPLDLRSALCDAEGVCEIGLKEVAIEYRIVMPDSSQPSGRTPRRVCSKCGRDLSSMPADIKSCPYCGAKLTRRLCPYCKKDLTLLPGDIRACPYCGTSLDKTFSLQKKLVGAVFFAIPFVFILAVKRASPVFILELFFAPATPYPLLFLPYLGMSLYLTLSPKPRKMIDIAVIFACAVLLYPILTVPL